MRGTPSALRERLLSFAPSDVAISEVVRCELEFGACRSRDPERNRANLLHYLRYVQVLEFGPAQSLEAAAIRCELVNSGQPIGPYDTLIACHARSFNVVLVTHNTREFARVERLRIEDWELEA